MKKYEFTGETKDICSGGEKITLHRIRALQSFDEVKTGDLGGWIEDERNLSHNGNCWVFDNGWVSGNGRVSGNGWVSGNGDITKPEHLLSILPIGSRGDCTTFYRSKDNQIWVTCGCFCGALDKFVRKVEKTHGNNKHGSAYKIAIELAKAQIDLT